MLRSLKTVPSFLFAALLALSLSGCAPQGATSTEGPELIHQVFPGWRPDKNEFPRKAFNMKENPDRPYPALFVTPEQVAKLSDSEVVLITKGSPSNAGHVSAALMSAYWFTLKEGRWQLTRRQDEVDWLGQSGDFGKVSLKPLAPGVAGVFVENGWSGGGTDSLWMDGYSVDSKGAAHVLHAMVLHQTEDNAGGYECGPLLKNPPKLPLSVTLENTESMNEKCMQLSATWEVVPSQTGSYAEILANQKKSRVIVQTLSIKETNNGYGDIGEFKIRVAREESKLVYRYDAAKRAYALKAGRDLRESF